MIAYRIIYDVCYCIHCSHDCQLKQRAITGAIGHEAFGTRSLATTTPSCEISDCCRSTHQSIASSDSWHGTSTSSTALLRASCECAWRQEPRRPERKTMGAPGAKSGTRPILQQPLNLCRAKLLIIVPRTSAKLSTNGGAPGGEAPRAPDLLSRFGVQGARCRG